MTDGTARDDSGEEHQSRSYDKNCRRQLNCVEGALKKLDLGLNIPETETTPAGVLSLRANGGVVFERKALDCLDLGKPTFVWIPGTHDCFIGQGFELLAGQLAVQGESVLIAGHDVSCVPRTLFTWDVHTGHRTPLATGATALLPEWKLGVRDPSDSFVELLDFPRGRSFFG